MLPLAIPHRVENFLRKLFFSDGAMCEMEKGESREFSLQFSIGDLRKMFRETL